MKPIYKFLFFVLAILLIASIGINIYQETKKRQQDANISELIKNQGENKIIKQYTKDSVVHTVFRDKIINDSKAEKQLAIGKTYADSLQKALKLSLDKIDQVTKINARLEAQLLLKTDKTASGKIVKSHKDQYLDLTYFPETDSLNFAYNINLNDVRYKEKKWFLGREDRYINLFSDDKRVTVNGVKTFRLKESPRKRFGVGFHTGYGIGKDGSVVRLVPYVGIGFNYNLLEF